MEKVPVGIIGGSGLYDIDGLEKVEKITVETPFGSPSDAFVVGTLNGVRCAFLPRHGRGHHLSPSELNYRANIYAFKKLGAEKLISISAVGSLKEELKPRDFVIPDQLLDRTKSRVCTFFGDGIVAHVSFADPFCPCLSELAYTTAVDVGISVHKGGTYVCIEGPQFSTRAESHSYRQLNCAIIGMTNLPEAKLAREAELCYATVALVTDYDCWKADEEVSLEQVLAHLHANSGNAKRFVRELLPRLSGKTACRCGSALETAIVSARETMPAATVKKMQLLIGKYIR
ncbi:MAG: S-methyl-5'-thioadenosine phosphorylase [Candidatus Omnitrophica bacterium]|nr:S-methyl-5'-thioadenosine phosphorylase [Candidatus Omnitrophota bacterium]